MSVPVSKREKSKFEVLIKGRELVKYTLTITQNDKIFLPKYKTALTDDIIQTSKNIFIKCWTANNIRVTSKEQSKKRLDLQKDAILECNNLLALIDLSKVVYHLKNKRVKYWAINTIEVRKLIREWHNNDIKRYEIS